MTAFFCMVAIVALRLHAVVAPHAPAHSLWAALGGICAGVLFADLASGVVHWLADNWGSETWPIVGASFIRPFRQHHADPGGITRHGFVELNGNSCLGSLPMFFLALDQPFDRAPLGSIFGSVFWLSTALWILGTNLFHAWAHTDDPKPWIRWLQRRGFVLSREHHAQHHQPPYNRNYCITTGWMNPVLGRLKFFETLERLVTSVSGAKPRYLRTLAEK